jgi:hypothetical protein
MSAEDSWAADTVALGGQNSKSERDRPEPPQQRAPKRKGSVSVSGVVVTCAVALAVVAALVAILGGESGSPKAPIRDAADPEARVVGMRPTRIRRRELRRVANSHIRHRAKRDQLEGKRDPKASAATSDPDEPEPVPAPATEVASDLATEPAPSSPPPTPPAVEFGM